MNPIAGLLHISNTIFKKIDYTCKKYLTPNSLALQRRQISECLLYRTLLYVINRNITTNQFIKDNYEELQILLNVALEDCRGIGIKEIWKIYLSTFFAIMIHLKKALFNMKLIPSHWYSEKGLVVFDENQESSIQVVQNNNEPILTSIFQVLERIRRQKINVRHAIELDSKKHKGRGHLANKRYLLAIENHNNNNVGSNNQDEDSESRPKKENKC
ncbi:16147_t:CDS:2 [Dentiscutata erythropus]|uniref:16147_t:CDS:1 n=1 Tax=Dentiscutata erythropus TaxID=1348616 RepID=A0A9N9DRA7_9GLOM|nr:16147_t:CDS:2 [Dentiscutata erythropus]